MKQYLHLRHSEIIINPDNVCYAKKMKVNDQEVYEISFTFGHILRIEHPEDVLLIQKYFPPMNP